MSIRINQVVIDGVPTKMTQIPRNRQELKKMFVVYHLVCSIFIEIIIHNRIEQRLESMESEVLGNHHRLDMIISVKKCYRTSSRLKSIRCSNLNMIKTFRKEDPLCLISHLVLARNLYLPWLSESISLRQGVQFKPLDPLLKLILTPLNHPIEMQTNRLTPLNLRQRTRTLLKMQM